MWGRSAIEAYVRGRGVDPYNEGKKIWRTGSFRSGLETTIYDSHWWRDSHGIRVKLEYDNKISQYVYTISLVYGKKEQEHEKVLNKFYIETIEGTCPKCKGKNICNENGRFICGCGFDYTEDSIAKLSEIDEYCNALKTGIGIKMIDVDKK